MKSIVRVVAVAVVLLTSLVCSAVCANQTAEGQVVSVGNCVTGKGDIYPMLEIRTQPVESLVLSPTLEHVGGTVQPSRPARTILPALEAGEKVRVSWTVDEKEHRNRIDSIEVISPAQGTTKGIVFRATDRELVIRPQEKPGTVTLNNKWVQIEGKWVPEPEMARRLASLKPGAKVTVGWEWDKEGRKRVLSVKEGW